MNLLANVLPGFRDVRTPLITGYLYLVWLWLMVDRKAVLPSDAPNTLQERIIDLSQQVDRVVVFGALSVVAYLLGSLMVMLSSSLLHAAIGSGLGPRRSFELHRWLENRVNALVRDGATIEEVFTRHAFPRDVLERLEPVRTAASERDQGFDDDLAMTEPEDSGNFTAVWTQNDLELQASGMSEVLAEELERSEFDALATNLQMVEARIWNDYDRLRAESELRIALVIPTASICVTAVVFTNWIALAGLAIPALLLVQAWALALQSRRKVWASLIQGVTKSPTLLQLESVTRTAAQSKKD